MTDLFAPLGFRHGPELKNRFVLAPLTNCQSHDDGRLSDAEFHWLTMRARGGFGLTMTCAAHVQAQGRGFPGQLGIFSDNHRRTATVRTIAPTSLLLISAQKVRELYYQNPRFGFYLVGLITQRLMQNADIEAGMEAVAGGEHAPTPRSG